MLNRFCSLLTTVFFTMRVREIFLECCHFGQNIFGEWGRIRVFAYPLIEVPLSFCTRYRMFLYQEEIIWSRIQMTLVNLARVFFAGVLKSGIYCNMGNHFGTCRYEIVGTLKIAIWHLDDPVWHHFHFVNLLIHYNSI